MGLGKFTYNILLYIIYIFSNQFRMDEIPSLLAAQQPLKVKLGALDILKGLTDNASSVVHITSCKPVVDILWNCLAGKFLYY